MIQNLRFLKQVGPMLTPAHVETLRNRFYTRGYGRAYKGRAPWRDAYERALERLTWESNRAALHELHQRLVPVEARLERAWREIAEIDADYESGAINQSIWHHRMAALVVPAYLAGDNRYRSFLTPGYAQANEPDVDFWMGEVPDRPAFCQGPLHGHLTRGLGEWQRDALVVVVA